MLNNTPNQPSKFKTQNPVKINDNQTRFKTSKSRLSLCDYSGTHIYTCCAYMYIYNIYTYILVKGTITVARATTAAPDNDNKEEIFKNCAPFINSIRRINNTQVDDAHDIDVVIQMYNLIEYSDNYLKTSGILWQFYKDVPNVDNNGAIVDFTADSATNWFKIKQKITGKQGTMAQIKLK